MISGPGFAPRLAEKVRRGEAISPILSALLTTATPLTRLGMWIRLHQARVRVPAHVISFGNITAGGTGKTPAVIERARAEMAAGRKVAILTRGYGGKRGQRMAAVVGGPKCRRSWPVIGDEPALIGTKLPGVVIVCSADRVAGARYAMQEHQCDTLILDDGFQYVRLERNENVALIDATNPFGNGRLIPRGILREPLGALNRATHIVLTHCDEVANVQPLLNKLASFCPGVLIRKTRHAPTNLWRVCDGSTVALDFIRGKTVTALCAIGNPESFIRTLEALGATVGERRIFPDHHVFTASELPNSGIVVTTEKDAIRIDTPSDNLLALGVELKDVNGDSAP